LPPDLPGSSPGSPSPSPQTDRARHALLAFGRAAASAARWRLRGFALFDLATWAAGATLVAVAVAAQTLRGDLIRPVWWALLAISAVTILARAWVSARRRFGSAEATARSVAAHPARLSHRTDEAAWQAERLLRHEYLGALELAGEIGREEPDDASRPRSKHSPSLAARYMADVAARLGAPHIDPALALPRPRGRLRVWVAPLLAAGLVACALWPPAVAGWLLLIDGADGRPPTPPEPVWSSLTLDLQYPEHTGRPRRTVPNPSGALRVVAGTTVDVQLTARRRAAGGKVVINYDPTELTDAPAPDIQELTAADTGDGEPTGLTFEGSFVARGNGTWTVVLLDDEDDEVDEASRRSAALPLQLEPDRPPEVELQPLPQARQQVSETDAVDLSFSARDDFGVVSAELVYQLPDGTSHRLAAGEPARPQRTWRNRYSWDLSQIPISERSEVLYWIEVRDNDPGLGLDPLPDPPGKVTRSATMRLMVEDDEAEHAANIVKLAELRDAAVDLLAARMLTRAFDREPATPPTDPAKAVPALGVRVRAARDILSGSETLLAMIATAIDALSMDTLTHERDVATLTDIHGRLMKLHREEMAKHEDMPPGIARRRPTEAAEALIRLGPHNEREVRQLEDEIIRLDDLVDGQIVERLEALVARLEATQRKLVELLEQLKAGDESVRSQIDQLQQRRREDLRRIAEARSMLRREVDEEFMNLDAFQILEDMAAHERIEEMLRRGEVDRALEQARGQLGEVQQLRDQVQQQAGKAGQTAELSEEERQRMQLLRELSRLQDEEGTVRSQTRSLHEKWREGVGEQKADEASRRRAERDAQKIREALEGVNDARLGREGRRGLDDARRELEKLESMTESEDAKQLDLAEAAERATRALQQAKQGSEEGEKEGKQVGKALRQLEGLRDSMRGKLPDPDGVLSEEELSSLGELQRRQDGLRKRTRELMGSELSKPLPAPGRRALRSADQGMRQSADRLERRSPRDAIDDQNQAWDGIQRAIDSLRRGSPPPPTGSPSGDASTEAERDRSLRDQLMDAMREGAPDGYDEPVKRYYEELLR
jgi:hypothetical protein